MKKDYILKSKRNSVLLLAVIFLSTMFFSCKDDDDKNTGPAYFKIEGEPTGLSLGVEGNEKTPNSYVVRSNRPWTIVPESRADWIKIFPEEGDDDGIFKIIVKENLTFDERVMNLSFFVDGKEEPVLFRVEQTANVPFLSINDAEKGISVIADGGEFVITLKANVDWDYTIQDGSWLSEVERTETQLRLSAVANEGKERKATVKVTSPTSSALSAEIVITQSDGAVIFEEDFSWLNYGDATPYETGGEKRYDTWTEAEKNRGWESTPNPVDGQQCVYARPGFIKLGKTNVGADIISPRLKINGTKNVKVTFKAAAYISKGNLTGTRGTVDDRILKIFLKGDGVLSHTQFEVDNIPNDYQADTDGVDNDIWDPARALSFTITGATSNTQIGFLGSALDLKGIGSQKNRIFLDDIKVEIIP